MLDYNDMCANFIYKKTLKDRIAITIKRSIKNRKNQGNKEKINKNIHVVRKKKLCMDVCVFDVLLSYDTRV